MTANLNINYKAPTLADQFIVIKVKLDEAKGRKSRVSGTVEDMAGNVLVEAKYVLVFQSTRLERMLTGNLPQRFVHSASLRETAELRRGEAYARRALALEGAHHSWHCGARTSQATRRRTNIGGQSESVEA